MSKTDGKADEARAGAVHEGALNAAGRRFALCVSRFNDFIVDKLVDGAKDALRRTGADAGAVEIFRCPGAMELPGLARRVVESGRFDGVVCLGAVIRGGTPHFDFVAGEAARGLGALAAEGRLPVSFGVLTCDTREQALERAGDTNDTNRGHDAAMVAVEMADLYARLGAGATAAPPAAAARLPRRAR
jgi:6,7-dimethyl-8-ribityllumazine synthase